MFDFIGKVHPLLVHLPIGFLLIAVVFIWIKEPGRVLKISIGLGALAAIASVITGLLLSNNQGYNAEVQPHKWSGISLMIVSIALWFTPEKFLKPGSIVMTVLVVLTGHLGGTLTHGSIIEEKEADNLDVSHLDFNNAIFYDDAVKPILEARCYSCHGPYKQKGGLRLDSQEAIDKGGKNGKAIVSGNPGESEISKRIELPLDDEDHMPPKEKRQLTDQEKKLISLWIASGADFTKKISESLDEKETSELKSKETGEIVLPEIDPANEDIIKKLVEENLAITHVSNGSNFLSVNFVSVPNEAEKLFEELRPIATNVYSLKMNNARIATFSLTDFENLAELNLSNTQVSDIMLDEILKCKSLVRLNLANTKVTNVDTLSALENLRYLNVYGTSVKEVNLPKVEIEKGNYDVPTFKSDTTFVKPKGN